MAGTLFVVATPLGNLEDLSPRAAATLRLVSLIACEDTRRTAKILTRFGIATPTISCHEFNEISRLDPVLDELRSGRDVALVSDGGTPAISDPGSLLVRAARQARLRVAPIAGPSAVVAILSASGLPADRFVFEGFLPHREGRRRRRLRDLRAESRTLVLFEAPHRIRQTLADLAEIFGERPIVLGREMTKIHETILDGSARTLLGALGEAEIKGEIALAIAGRPETDADHEREWTDDPLIAAWRAALAESGGDRREALRRAARTTGLKKAEAQRRLAELREI